MRSSAPQSRAQIGPFRVAVLIFLLAVACLAGPPHAFAQAPEPHVVISEIMGNNDTLLRDEDGEYTDWIELQNLGREAVDLGGWYLSNSAENLTQWQFPSVVVEAGETLVVFASGKDRSGAELHADFRLGGAGEFLALVRPDGVTVADAFDPAYPEQPEDRAYGLLFETNVFIGPGAQVQVRVPQDGALGETWTEPDFAPTEDWLTSKGGVGFGIADVYAAGELLVNLDAGDLSTGTLPRWPNRGTLGDFTSSEPPTVETVDGVAAVRFDGLNDWMRSELDAPETITGSSDWSIEVWVFNDQIGLKDTMLSWAVYTGPSGRSAVMNYGSSPETGAIEHRTYDMGYQGGPPAPGMWRHIALTYSGGKDGLERLYVDGALNRSQVANLNIHGPGDGNPFPVVLGASTGRADLSAVGGDFSGALAAVRIHPAQLTSEEVLNNFASEAAHFGRSIPAETQIQSRLAIIDMESRMRDVNASAYVRFPFDIDNPERLDTLTLKMQYDDGFVAWLNGERIVSRNAPDQPTWNAQATAARGGRLATLAESISLSPFLGLLRPGSNVLAVQGLNVEPSDGDFRVLPELVGASVARPPDSEKAVAWYLDFPTPGKPNWDREQKVVPAIHNPIHSPNQPREDEDLIVSVQVAATSAPLAGVAMTYRVMYGPKNRMPMADDGVEPDATADDGIYTARIPQDSYDSGEMVRWCFHTTDTAGGATRWPPFFDPLDSPEYLGTVVEDPSATSTIPILNWFCEDLAAAHTDAGTRASCFYKDRFYENFLVRHRGLGKRTLPKRAFKFDFNRNHGFYYDLDGLPVEEFNLQSHYSEPVTEGGTSYMRENLGFLLLNRAGTPSPIATHLQLRHNGAFYGLYSYIEQIDDVFLERNGLNPLSPMYKALQDGTMHPNPTTAHYRKVNRRSEPWDDFIYFSNGFSGLGGVDRFIHTIDTLNLANYINEMATQTIMPNHDRLIKNYYMYLDPTKQEWFRVPWDLEQAFIQDQKLDQDPWANVLFGDNQHVQEPGQTAWLNYIHDAILDNPVTRAMYLRRLRTMVDTYLHEDATYLQDRIRSMRDLIKEEADRDNQKWQRGDIDVAVNVLINKVIPNRRAYLYRDPLVPDAQPENPDIRFGSIESTPLSGNQDEEYIELRNSELTPIDISSWTLTGSVKHFFPAGSVIPTSGSLYVSPNVFAFRSRVTSPTGGMGIFAQGNYAGRLPNFSGELQLTDEKGWLVADTIYQGRLSAAQRDLRITELMYNPAEPPSASGYDANDFEFIELYNIGAEPLALGGVALTNGVEFSFTSGTLAPGACILLVRNRAAMASRYGEGLPIAGEYSGGLSNAGETVRLEDASGERIVEFAYGDGRGWSLAADGLGHSLVPRASALQDAVFGSLYYGDNWRPSARIHGSPGLTDPEPEPALLLNEFAARTAGANDWLELKNVSAAPVSLADWYLSDDRNDLRKWALPAGSPLAADTRLVLSEADGLFGLGGDAEEVFLSHLPAEGPGRVADARGFLGQETEITRGRLPDGGRYWSAMPPTPDAQNAPLAPGVVIREIMYQPRRAPELPEIDGWRNSAEFVEIFNASDESVELGRAAEAWRLTGGVEFTFPAGAALAPGASLMVVGFPTTDSLTLDYLQQMYSPNQPIDLSLVGPGARANVLVPQDGALGTDWTAPDFRPNAAWLTTATGAGFGIRDIEVAGELLANLDAEGLPEGLLFRWENPGALGQFRAGSSSAPKVETVGGASAVTFEGEATWMQSKSKAPALITGREDWSVEVWAYNPEIALSETLVNWARLGARRRAAALGYGAAGGFGAMNHSGNDLGYADGAPAAGAWHHIAVTYSGEAGNLERVYVDGALNTSQTRSLDLYGPLEDEAIPVLLGATTGNLGLDNLNGFLSGSIATVRVHDGELSQEQVVNNFLADAGRFNAPIASETWYALYPAHSQFVNADLGNHMQSGAGGAYVRAEFQVEHPEKVQSLALRMRYDDGFVAYLNGVEVAGRNAPENPTWDATALQARTGPVARRPETLDLTADRGLLRDGANVLAIHGLNSAARDKDFLVFPELIAKALPTGTIAFAPAQTGAEPPSETLPVYGPWEGNLSNQGERLALERPRERVGAGQVPVWVIVDEAIYFNRAPWPATPGGLGDSLHRTLYTMSGNDPASWLAAAPSPGRREPPAPRAATGQWVLY